jgi:hypothetical protein
MKNTSTPRRWRRDGKVVSREIEEIVATKQELRKEMVKRDRRSGRTAGRPAELGLQLRSSPANWKKSDLQVTLRLRFLRVEIRAT